MSNFVTINIYCENVFEDKIVTELFTLGVEKVRISQCEVRFSENKNHGASVSGVTIFQKQIHFKVSPQVGRQVHEYFVKPEWSPFGLEFEIQ